MESEGSGIALRSGGGVWSEGVRRRRASEVGNGQGQGCSAKERGLGVGGQVEEVRGVGAAATALVRERRG